MSDKEESNTPELIEAAVIETSSIIESPDVVIEKTELEVITDQQIDDLLEEVQQIKNSSPVKLKEADDVTPPGSPALVQIGSDALEGLSKEDPSDTTATKSLKPAGIPKSVSQALFSGGLKLTKVKDKQVELKFLGLKKENVESNKKIKSLQLKLQEVNKKIAKLQKEINYLNNLIDTATISSDLSELRKLKSAIQRLEEFLDQKQKEKYEVGVVMTRAVRRRIDSGESGEFWATA